MKLAEIIDNAGYEFDRHIETAYGTGVAKAAERFNISAWEPETGGQVGVSYNLLLAIALGGPMDRLYWAGKVDEKRKHAFADARNCF